MFRVRGVQDLLGPRSFHRRLVVVFLGLPGFRISGVEGSRVEGSGRAGTVQEPPSVYSLTIGFGV